MSYERIYVGWIIIFIFLESDYSTTTLTGRGSVNSQSYEIWQAVDKNLTKIVQNVGKTSSCEYSQNGSSNFPQNVLLLINCFIRNERNAMGF